MTWRIVVTPTAADMLKRITDRRIRATIVRRIDGLADNPLAQGKALLGPLSGVRSIRTAGRYRILFRIEDTRVIVVVLFVGMRKDGSKRDVYELARKLIKLRLLD